MGQESKNGKSKEIHDPLENFMYCALTALYPDAETRHEPVRLTTGKKSTVPDIAFELCRDLTVYMELTKTRLTHWDPKESQGRILRTYERRVDENARSLVLYLQHFMTAKIVHASIGVLIQLATGKIGTNEARNQSRNIAWNTTIDPAFKTRSMDWDKLYEETVNGSTNGRTGYPYWG